MNFKFVVFSLLTLIAPTTFGQSPIIPKSYKTIKSGDNNCVSLTFPKAVKGAEVCSYSLPIAESAFKANFFELIDNKWHLIGPGIPVPAKVKELDQVTFVEGITFCQIEDKSGIHSAGGKCYYGMAFSTASTLTFRSNAIDLRRLNKTSFSAYVKAFEHIARANYKN